MDLDVVHGNVENKFIGLKTLNCEYYYFCCMTVMCYVSESDVWKDYFLFSAAVWSAPSLAVGGQG
jgi:hypothetical protein